MDSRKFYTIVLFSFLTISLQAQEPKDETVSVGAGYFDFMFYKFKDGSKTTYQHTQWDIAFSTDFMDGAVFVNEGTGSNRTLPPPEVELYHVANGNYADLDTTGMIRIYNEDNSWTMGAFNNIADPNNVIDQGWGNYNPQTRGIEGTQVFVIKLRNGQFKKLEIQSYSSMTASYAFRYADLDGNNETSESISKTAYAGKTLVYYSIENEEVLDLEPEAGWDFVFTRYYTPLPFQGDFLQYLLTGMLTNKGVEVVRADGVNVDNVDYLDYADDYSADSLRIIGHDWKDIDFNTFEWFIIADRAYFVRTAEGEIYKLVFVDFEGSRSGIASFEQTLLGTSTSTKDEFENLESFNVFPNPATDLVQMAFDLKESNESAVIRITNALGQSVLEYNRDVRSGFQVIEIPIDLASGMYYLSLQMGQDQISRPFVVK
ncbi:MAG: HmuY family protein [Bacteroidota bacterium]